MSNEKRKHVRFDAVNPSEVVIYGTDDSSNPVREGRGKTVNISRGGALLETPFPISNEQRVSLTINIDTESVFISGRVIHTRCETTTCYKTGIEFTAIEARGQQILNKYISLFMKNQVPPVS